MNTKISLGIVLAALVAASIHAQTGSTPVPSSPEPVGGGGGAGSPSLAGAFVINATSVPLGLAPRRAIVPIERIGINNTGNTPVLFWGVGFEPRKGSVKDDNFGGLMLFDETGGTVLSGPVKLDLEHRVNLGCNLKFEPRQFRQLMVAMAMENDLATDAGMTVGFDISWFGSDSTNVISNSESGSLQAINQTLEIGDFTVRNSASLQDHNVSAGITQQILGGFDVDVSSVEGVIFPGLDVDIESNGGDVTQITLVYLTDENGKVVAGPVNAVRETTGGNAAGVLHFADSIVLPKGPTTHLIAKGKVGTSFMQGADYEGKIRLRIDTTKIIGRGMLYGYNFFPKQQNIIVSSTLTVKETKLRIGISGYPGGNEFPGGLAGAHVATITLDATQSVEDIQVNGIPLALMTFDMPVDSFTNCRMFDGSTPLNGNIVNPQPTVLDNEWYGWFTFDSSGLVVPKGTTKTLILRCDIEWGVQGWFTWVLGQAKLPAAGVTTGTYPRIVWGNWWSGWGAVNLGKG